MEIIIDIVFLSQDGGKHDLTSFLIAEHDPALDITVFIDVARNPEPDQSINSELDDSGGKFKTTNTNRQQYTRDQILNIGRNNCYPTI